MTRSENGAPEEPRADADSLRRAARAFELGDFATVRRLCDELKDASDPRISQLAAKLHAQTRPDRAEYLVLALCLLFFGWVVARYLL